MARASTEEKDQKGTKTKDIFRKRKGALEGMQGNGSASPYEGKEKREREREERERERENSLVGITMSKLRSMWKRARHEKHNERDAW